MENTSEKILNRFLLGSDTAAFALFERYQNRLIVLARGRLMDCVRAKVAPEDILQEAFTAFFELADSGGVRWEKEGDLWRLLAGIAINKVRKNHEYYLRDKRSVAREDSLGSPHELDDVTSSSEAINELVELTESLLDTAKPLLRQVLQQRLAGFTMEEIAQQTGRSARTIRRLLDGLGTKIVASEEMPNWRAFNEPLSKAALNMDGQWNGDVSYSDFQLLNMIGSGSTAKVYQARHISTDRMYAIKAIRKKWLGRADAIRSFCREYQLLSKLTEPSLVRAYGIGQLPNGGCFIVLELIQGKAIAKLLDQANSEQRTEWANQIREAGAKLKIAGVEHGDLHLENIMVDAESNVRIVDFGFSRLIEPSQSTEASDGCDVVPAGFEAIIEAVINWRTATP